MSKLPTKIKKTVMHLSMLSGVGEKTAMRYALSMMNWRKENLLALADSLTNLSTLNKCQECFLVIDEEVCALCEDERRRIGRKMCVVESYTDYLAIEKSGHFDGLFHILGGTLNPLGGIGPEQLTLEKLFSRIKELGISEVLLALNPTVEGDVTSAYIKQKLGGEIKVERIGLGIPMGGNLEYLDSMTIMKALENRKAL